MKFSDLLFYPAKDEKTWKEQVQDFVTKCRQSANITDKDIAIRDDSSALNSGLDWDEVKNKNNWAYRMSAATATMAWINFCMKRMLILHKGDDQVVKVDKTGKITPLMELHNTDNPQEIARFKEEVINHDCDKEFAASLLTEKTPMVFSDLRLNMEVLATNSIGLKNNALAIIPGRQDRPLLARPFRAPDSWGYSEATFDLGDIVIIASRDFWNMPWILGTYPKQEDQKTKWKKFAQLEALRKRTMKARDEFIGTFAATSFPAKEIANKLHEKIKKRRLD